MIMTSVVYGPLPPNVATVMGGYLCCMSPATDREARADTVSASSTSLFFASAWEKWSRGAERERERQ